MRLIIEDIFLEDDETPEGGIAYANETLSDFIRGGATEETRLDIINGELRTCGIKPIKINQIKIVGVEGE